MDAMKIEPALTPEEWKIELSEGRPDEGYQMRALCGHPTVSVIALANAALSDDDPRKITRERIALLRSGARAIISVDQDRCISADLCTCYADADALVAFADALESLLPPE